MKQLCKVLIVDDEMLVRQGIKHHMNWEQHGFQIVGEASNGKEGLELVESLRPHIIITDIVMPVMDGEEFTRIVKRRYPEIEVIVLSSYGEFQYVRSTFQSGVADYILKPKMEAQELLQVLQAAASRIPHVQFQLADQEESSDRPLHHLLEKLVSGYSLGQEAALLREYFPHEAFCLVGIEAASDKFGANLDSLGEHLIAAPVPVAEKVSVYVINLDRTEYLGLLAIVRKLANESATELSMTSWVITGLFDDIQQIGEEYANRLLRLMGYNFYFPDRALIVEDELPARPEVMGSFNLKEYAEKMKRKSFEAAFAELREYTHQLAKDYTSSAFEFKAFLGNIVFNTTVLLGNLDYEIQDLDAAKYSYFKAIEEVKHVGEAVSLLDNFLAEVGKRIEQEQGVGSSMKRLLRYIEEHYGEPLTLTALAQHFHFNPSYLSSYFSSHNKEGFSEYLNKIRVEKAAGFLRSTSLSISEISSRVGYSDHSYFTKVFKKYTGTSPSQYRRQQIIEKRD